MWHSGKLAISPDAVTLPRLAHNAVAGLIARVRDLWQVTPQQQRLLRVSALPALAALLALGLLAVAVALFLEKPAVQAYTEGLTPARTAAEKQVRRG